MNRFVRSCCFRSLFFEKSRQAALQNRKIVSYRQVHRFVIDPEVMVHDLIPHTGSGLLGNLRVLIPEFPGHILGSFSDNGQHALNTGAFQGMSAELMSR